MQQESSSLEVRITQDGSPTLFSAQFHECYHSTRGALSEAQHICIENGLMAFSSLNNIRILEYGFGLGINLYVTLRWTIQNSIAIDYTTLELYPVPEDIVAQVSLPEEEPLNSLWQEAHKTVWERPISITQHFVLTKSLVDFIEYIPAAKSYHLIFFDAFSPKQVPEQWSSAIFSEIYNSLLTGGRLVTYSASGTVKDALRQAGFQVHRLKGAMGKHHMLMAVKL